MEEKETAKITIDKESAAVYKWIKLCQSIILRVLGVIFFVLGRRSKDGGIKEDVLSYSIGIVFAVYGIRNILSGYLLNRNVTNSDVLFGLRSISFSLVLFCKTEIITVRFPIFLITFFYALSAMRIVTGVDHIVGKGTKKSISHGVWDFIGAAALIGGITTYLIFYIKKNPDLFRFVLMILGVLVFLFGIVSGIMLLVRVHNTKKIRKEESFTQPVQENRSTEVRNKDVRVINLSDLKKSGRKSTNKAGYKPLEEKEKKRIEDTKEDEEGKGDPDNDKENDDSSSTASFEPKDENKSDRRDRKNRKK